MLAEVEITADSSFSETFKLENTFIILLHCSKVQEFNLSDKCASLSTGMVNWKHVEKSTKLQWLMSHNQLINNAHIEL